MRAVAHALGVVPMSLYTYVPGKAELLDLMLDTVYRQMPRSDLSGMPWRERLATIAQENRDLFTLHPWIAEVSTGQAPARPRPHGRSTTPSFAFEGLGLDDVEMDAALTFLLGFISGRRAFSSRRGRRPAGQRDEWRTNGGLPTPPCSPGYSTRRSTPRPPASAPP